MLEFIWPLINHAITRDFYFKASLYIGGQHAALDMIDPSGTLGKPVLATADGTAMANPLDYYSGLNVYVEHAGGWRSGYRHFSAHVLPLNVPTPVHQGDVIGYAGSTGVSTGPHLHFDLWNKAKMSPEAFFKVGWWAHDPALYLGKEELIVQPPVVTPPVLEDDMALVSQDAWNDLVQKVNWCYAILFDDVRGDSATDFRRLIGIGQMVKATQVVITADATKLVELQSSVEQLLRDSFTGTYRVSGTGFMLLHTKIKEDGSVVHLRHAIPDSITLLRLAGLPTKNLPAITAAELAKYQEGSPVPSLKP